MFHLPWNKKLFVLVFCLFLVTITSAVAQKADPDIPTAEGQSPTHLDDDAQRAKQTPVLNIHAPGHGAVIKKPLITVQGTATPGAVITAGGMSTTAHTDSAFELSIPIPDEVTEYELKILAEIDGEKISKTRTVRYEPPLRLIVSNPVDSGMAQSRKIPVRGNVFPATAAVTVNDVKAAVRSDGSFTQDILLPFTPGTHQITISASRDTHSVSETRIVHYELHNTDIPELLGPVVTDQKLCFTVNDRTIGDSITMYYEKDGFKNKTQRVPGERFCMDMSEGIHRYVVYAVDRAGNTSRKWEEKKAWLPRRRWDLRVRRPTGDGRVRLSPSISPDDDYEEQYRVEFSIENLPNDNPALLTEIIVTNKTLGSREVIREPDDIDFEVDTDIRLGKNIVEILVRDINNDIVQRQFTITLQ